MELVEQLLRAFYNLYRDPKYLNPRGIPGIVLAVKADLVDLKDLPKHRSSLFRQKINRALREMIDEDWIEKMGDPQNSSDYSFDDWKKIIRIFWGEFSERKMKEEMESSWDEENQWFRLTAQGRKHAEKLVGRETYQARAKEKSISKELKKVDPNTLFDLLKFHPRIKEVSEGLFKNGYYALAILEAFKTVNNFVKEKSGKQEWDGKDLMSKVFKKESPIIRFNELKTRFEKNEQEGFMFLFMGAWVGIRNPKAHDNIRQTDPYKTLEYLSFASLLARKVEEGKLVHPLTDMQKKIIEYISEKGRITTNETKKVLGVTVQTTIKELQELVKLKIIQSKGKGRGIYYILSK